MLSKKDIFTRYKNILVVSTNKNEHTEAFIKTLYDEYNQGEDARTVLLLDKEFDKLDYSLKARDLNNFLNEQYELKLVKVTLDELFATTHPLKIAEYMSNKSLIIDNFNNFEDLNSLDIISNVSTNCQIVCCHYLNGGSFEDFKDIYLNTHLEYVEDVFDLVLYVSDSFGLIGLEVFEINESQNESIELVKIY